jgi:hypothetical protein
MEDNPAYKLTVLRGEGVRKTALIIQFLSRTFVESIRTKYRLTVSSSRP